jgi:hypothetical protein
VLVITRPLFYWAAVMLLSTWALTAQVKSGDESPRTRANLTETILTTAVVDVSRFGRLYSYSVDGTVKAEPLYVSDVNIGGALHNVLYVATASGKLYAFDAEAASAPLWIADLTRQSSVHSQWIPHIIAHPSRRATVSWNSPTDGPVVYAWPENDVLKAYCRTPGREVPLLCMQGVVLSREFRGSLTLSANGSTHGSGIVWASLPGTLEGIHGEVGGLLGAYDAETLNELWTSEQNSARDRAGRLAPSVPPVVANGRVYMANMDGSVVVYGPLPDVDADVSFSTTPRRDTTTLGHTHMVTAAVGALADGAAIGINFLGTSSALMAATETAGVVPQTAWNNAAGAARSTPLALINGAGDPTTATVTWTANNGWMTPITDQPGNARMMKGYLDNNNTTITTVSVAGLPSRDYDVYVYTDGDNKGYERTASYAISGPNITPTSVNVIDPPYANFSGTLTAAAGSAGNYVRFRINSTAFTITATPGTSTNANVRAPINGIQIVPAVAPPVARAIAINFLGTSTAMMATTETAGVVPQTRWNNASGAARSTPLALVNAAQETTTATVTWTANNGWMTPITDQPGNARMMKGYLDNINTSVTTVSVAGLPPGAYDVYVYADGDNKTYTRTASYTLTASDATATTITLTDAPNTNFSGTFTQAANTAGNYLKFNFTGTGFTLTARPGTSTNVNVRAPVNAIQIVSASPTPPVVLDAPLTITGIGAGQGIEVRDGKVYLYGDAATGVVREYDVTAGNALTYTGRQVLLTGGGRDLVSHPTGLTTAPGQGTLLGNTVSAQGTIRLIDWPQALMNGTLDGAVLATIADDLAVNGTRPEFVRVGDRWLVATADYGAVSNEVRLYDPDRLRTATRTSEPGVLVYRFPSSPYVQTLHWIDSAGLLVLVQNRSSGQGWRLTVVDLARSLAAGQEVATQIIDLSPQDELEGFHMVAPGRGLFLTSSSVSNLYFANVRLF